MAQTPQAASIALLKRLYARIAAEPLNFTPTDEASILEYFGESVYIVKGNAANDKLTTPEDFEIFRQPHTLTVRDIFYILLLQYTNPADSVFNPGRKFNYLLDAVLPPHGATSLRLEDRNPVGRPAPWRAT